MSINQATITNAANAYAAFLAAGTSYAEALATAAKECGGTPCPTLLAALAAVHARKYGCNYTWNGAGRAVFHTGAESTRETRHDAAHKSWQRNVMVHFTIASDKPRAAADPVKALLAKYAALTAAQKRQFKAAI